MEDIFIASFLCGNNSSSNSNKQVFEPVRSLVVEDLRPWGELCDSHFQYADVSEDCDFYFSDQAGSPADEFVRMAAAEAA